MARPHMTFLTDIFRKKFDPLGLTTDKSTVCDNKYTLRDKKFALVAQLLNDPFTTTSIVPDIVAHGMEKKEILHYLLPERVL